MSLLLKHWYTRYLEDADFYSDISFLNSNPKSIFEEFGSKNSKLSFSPKNLHTDYLEDADSYSDISFLKFQTQISRMQIFILTLVFWYFKPKSIFWGN